VSPSTQTRSCTHEPVPDGPDARQDAASAFGVGSDGDRRIGQARNTGPGDRPFRRAADNHQRTALRQRNRLSGGSRWAGSRPVAEPALAASGDLPRAASPWLSERSRLPAPRRRALRPLWEARAAVAVAAAGSARSAGRGRSRIARRVGLILAFPHLALSAARR
jgi:hypothetical protein